MYQITTNRRNGTREIIRLADNRVIDQADMEDPAACVALSQRLVILNAQADAAGLAFLADEAMDPDTSAADAYAAGQAFESLAETIEAYAPELAMHYSTAPAVEASQPVPVTVPRSAVLAAVEAAREACQDSPRWFEAVSKAAVELDVQRWTWDGRALVIASRTVPGKWYTVTASACNCGHRCRWHRAAFRLVQLASQSSAPAAAPAPMPAPVVRPARPSFVVRMAPAAAIAA